MAAVEEVEPTSPVRLGWRARERPTGSFSVALGGAAGLFVVAAVVVLIVELAGDRDDVTGPGAGCTAGLLIAAYVAAQWRGPVRSAATTAVVLSVPLFFLFLIAGDGNASQDDVSLAFALSAVALAVAFFVGSLRARAVLLGATLIFAWAFLILQVSDSSSPIPFADSEVRSPFGESNSFAFNSSASSSSDVATASLIFGGVVLAVAFTADRRRLRGLGTPLVAVGAFTTLAGAVGLASTVDSAAGAGFIVAAAGLVVGIVGGIHQRRGTSWVGAITVVVGLAVVVANLAGDSNWGAIGLSLACAAGLLAVAMLLAWRLGNEGGSPDATDRAPSAAPTPVAVGATEHDPAGGETRTEPALPPPEPPLEPPSAATSEPVTATETGPFGADDEPTGERPTEADPSDAPTREDRTTNPDDGGAEGPTEQS